MKIFMGQLLRFGLTQFHYPKKLTQKWYTDGPSRLLKPCLPLDMLNLSAWIIVFRFIILAPFPAAIFHFICSEWRPPELTTRTKHWFSDFSLKELWSQIRAPLLVVGLASMYSMYISMQNPQRPHTSRAGQPFFVSFSLCSTIRSRLHAVSSPRTQNL